MDAERRKQLFAKVLKEELREDENSRKQGLEQFRDWILKNPDIQDCNTDDNFLLPYLRSKKYSIPMAQKTLLEVVMFIQNFKCMKYNIDIDDPDINDVITSGYHFSSPYPDRNGEVVSILIPRNFDVNKYNYEVSVRAISLNIHTLLWNEINHVLGVTYVIDFGDISAAYCTMFPVSVIKLLRALETLPSRTKSVHVVNIPQLAVWFANLILSLFSDKMQSRFKFHNSVEELHKHLDPSVLPKEYGGTMPMAEMIGLWKKEMTVHRKYIAALNNIKLVGDSYKKATGSEESGIPDLPGSFRKLDVD